MAASTRSASLRRRSRLAVASLLCLSLAGITQGTFAGTAADEGAAPAVTIQVTSALTAPIRASFSEPVRGVTSANYRLLFAESGTAAKVLSCRDGSGATVDCTTGNVRTAELQPATPLVPGQGYVTVVNPAGAEPIRGAQSGIAVQSASREFTAATAQEHDSPSARYGWRTQFAADASGGSYQFDRRAGARMDFWFTGTSVTWYTVQSRSQGLAHVYVDGVLKGSYNNYSSSARFGVGRTFGGLAAGSHTLAIVVRGLKGSTSGTDTRVAVDAFRVGDAVYLQESTAARQGWRIMGGSGGAPLYGTSDTAGSTVDFTFRGIGVDWYTVTGPSQGKAAIYVDGVRVSTVDNYAPNRAYGVRRRVSGLTDDRHTLRIRVLGQKRAAARGTVVSVDRWIVQSTSGSPTPNPDPSPTPQPTPTAQPTVTPMPTATPSPSPDPGGTTTRVLDVPHRRQATNKWCVAASVQMHLLSRGWSSPSQQTLYDYGLPRKRCNVGIDSGLDPLAWARMLYRYSPAGYYYDDYTYTSAYSGTRAMINQLYVRNEPAGALVNRGHHAFVLTGATTGCDPSRSACRNSSYTIKTVFINDPWYDRSVNSPGADPDGCAGTGGPYRCGRIGLRPNAAITYSTWATYYFTTWGNQPADCSYWNGKWVAVLRKPDGVAGTPTIAGPAATSYAGVEGPAKDPRFAPDEFAAPGQDASAPAAGPVEVRAASASIAHLDLAFARARLVHELGAQPDFRAALDGARVAGSVRVRSLTSGLPDYLLVPLRSRDGLRGVAMFTLSGGAPTFAGMTYADEPLARFPAVSPEDAAGSLAASGYVVTGAPELVWGWSDESSSPYYPFYRAATDRGLRYVDAYGDVLETIHLRG